MLRVLLSAALVGGAVVVGSATAAHACSCALLPGTSYLDQAEVAFIGHTTRSPTAVAAGVNTYEFTVDEVLKGDVGSTAAVTARSDGSACGTIFLTHRRYIVLAGARGDGTFETGLCFGSTRDRPGALERLSRELTIPTTTTDAAEESVPSLRADDGDDDSDVPVGCLLGAGLALVVVALVVVLRPRRSVRA